jgi:hypothetical protein
MDDESQSEYTFDEDGNTIPKRNSDGAGSGPHAVFSESTPGNGKDRGNESDDSNDEETESEGSGRKSPPAEKQKHAAGASETRKDKSPHSKSGVKGTVRPLISTPVLAAAAVKAKSLFKDSPLPAERTAELTAKLESKLFLAQAVEQQRHELAVQAERERVHRQDLDRARRRREESMKEAFKMAKDRLQMFTPGTMVEAWCTGFKETCDLFELDRDYALKLFFSRISTVSGSWITEFRVDDRQKGQKVTDVDRWIARLQRTHRQSYETQLQVVKNIRQDEHEAADAFVQRFRAMAKAANKDWSKAEIVNMIQDSVHPRWRQAFVLFNNGSKDFADVTSALSKAMSSGMESFRQIIGGTAAASASGGSMTAAAASFGTLNESNGQQSRSRSRRGSRSQTEVQGNAAHYGNWNNSNRQNQNQRTPPGNCMRCGQPGHWKRECPVLSMDSAALQTLIDAASQRLQDRNGSNSGNSQPSSESKNGQRRE